MSAETVICPFGKIQFPVGDLTLGEQRGDTLFTGRIGICEGCQRKWKVRTPAAEQAKTSVPLEVIAVDNEDKKHTATVTSCENAHSD